MVRARDILGLNARSLLYINKYNKRQHLEFADSKLKAKRFLEARGVRVAKLVRVYRDHASCTLEDVTKLPGNIVIKPNDSSGGAGILVLKDKKPFGWINSSGSRVTHAEVLRHCNNIVAGSFHGAGANDIVLIEKRIIAHPKLQPISYKGLPDVRVVVFNLVPVLAMIRLPTPQSAGKANLHLGGIAAGIDISKGEITYLTQYHKLIHELPGVGEIRGLKIPFWDQILYMASKVQKSTKLGYVGVDIALDKHGPILLEVNARAGLEIQVANLVPLRKRLRRIEGLKVKTVKQGITIAKSMFGRKVERDIEALSGKAVIGGTEYIYLHLPSGPRKYLAKINPMLSDNYVSTELFDELQSITRVENSSSVRLKYTMLHRKSQTILKPMSMPHPDVQIILGKRELSHFLIDPFKYKDGELPMEPDHLERVEHIKAQVSQKQVIKEWKSIDSVLYNIDADLTKAFPLMPTNYLDEQEKYIRLDGDYNPQFTYRRNEEIFEECIRKLDSLEIEKGIPTGDFFEKKRQELMYKARMLYNIGINAKEFTAYSHEFFRTNYDLIEEAKSFVKEYKKIASTPHKHTKVNATQMEEYVRGHLEKLKLTSWNIRVRNKGASRIGVGTSTKRNIYLRGDATFRKESVDSLLAHEIDTHVLRMESAFAQPYKIMMKGPHYLATEEGLAVYNQMKYLKKNQQKYYLPALNYIKTTRLHECSFREGLTTPIMSLLQNTFSSREDFLLRSFRSIFRSKRGLGDTSEHGGYTKDLVYYSGYLSIGTYLANGGDIESLYIGKVHIEDLPVLESIKEIKSATFLPPNLT